MSKLSTVSIIVLAYQGAKYLAATIDSILQQTCEDTEIVVFGDDDCRIIGRFGYQSNPRLKLILQSDSGLANTLNQGIVATTGEYLAFVNAGDLWQPSRLYKQVSCLNHYAEIGLVHSWSVLVDRQGKSTRKVLRQPYTARLETITPAKTPAEIAINLSQSKSDSNLQREILACNHLNAASVMVRRSCFDTVGLFDPALKIFPDWDMWIRLSLHYQFMTIAEPLVCCWQHVEHSQESCSCAETDLQTIIEQTYALLNVDRETQKPKSYGYASLFLADKVLQDRNCDPAIVNNYCYQALQHDSTLIFSLELCRLRWATFLLHYSQSDRYRYLEQLTKSFIGNLTDIVDNVHEQSQSLIDWMMEEEDSLVFWRNRQIEQQGKD